jgi:hypothetical protein
MKPIFMKKTNIFCIAAIFASLAMSGCSKVRPVDEILEVAPNETAFLIALDGDTMKNQKKFDSVAALESPDVKIAIKRVIIPHKLVDVCQSCSESDDRKYKDVATAKLVKINRSMVSREWTATSKGTSAKNQAITVESNESIDFDLGAVITAQVTEQDAALFLYTFGGKQLEEVIDQDVRNFIAQSLSASFGTHDLETGRKEKIAYFNQAKNEAKELFAKKGITLVTFGSTEGMTYHDEAIQRSINKRFEAQQANMAATEMANAAAKLTANREAVVLQQNYEIRKQEVENQKAAIAKWDGHGPTTMVGGSSGAMFNIPVNVSK